VALRLSVYVKKNKKNASILWIQNDAFFCFSGSNRDEIFLNRNHYRRFQARARRTDFPRKSDKNYWLPRAKRVSLKMSKLIWFVSFCQRIKCKSLNDLHKLPVPAQNGSPDRLQLPNRLSFPS
jgi:hypothetical protein